MSSIKGKSKHNKRGSSLDAQQEKDKDLIHYIDDRVELIQQIFKCLDPGVLHAMVPHSIKHLSNRELQELCLSEILGISSKRLCAVMNGTEPPSDTESSDSSHVISLESISSNESLLENDSNMKKKKKHHKKKKHKHKKEREEKVDDDASNSNAMLELLELQARARVIRARLFNQNCPPNEGGMANLSENTAQKDDCNKLSEMADDDEGDVVEIKLETDVLEISSGEETQSQDDITKNTIEQDNTVPNSNNRNAENASAEDQNGTSEYALTEKCSVNKKSSQTTDFVETNKGNNIISVTINLNSPDQRIITGKNFPEESKLTISTHSEISVSNDEKKHDKKKKKHKKKDKKKDKHSKKPKEATID